MYATCVNIDVKPEYKNEFIQATLANAKEARKEPENLRFDFLAKTGEPNKFMLYEVYATEQGALDHKKTTHYLKWREDVADFMATPREGVRYDGVKG